MPKGGLRSSDKSDDVINFLNSDEFHDLITDIVRKETSELHSKIETLNNEVVILRESNIQLINLLTCNNKEINTIMNANNVQELAPPKLGKTVSSSSYADKTKINGNGKNISDTRIFKKNAPTSKSINKIDTGDSTEHDPLAATEWTIQKPRKRRGNKLEVIIGSNKNECDIKGVSKFRHFHVYRLEPTMTSEKLINYIKTKNIPDVMCEKLNSKYPEEYSSFKISVPEAYANQVITPEMWPEGICINRFLFHLTKKKTLT